MKSMRILAASLLVLAVAGLSYAQDADAVLNRAISAMGGQAVLDSINSMSMSMKGTMQGSMEMSTKMMIVKPDKIRIDASVMGMDIIQARNGEDYWMSQGGTVTDMPDYQREQFRMSSQMYTGGGLAQLKELGIEFSYVGQETVNGVLFDVISVNLSAEMPAKFYFNTTTGLPDLMKVSTVMGEMEMVIADYRVVSGVKFAHHMEMIMGGQPLMTMDVTDLQINQPIDPSVFARPQ
jgi:outer membrane lipoprotein-sorting protein